MSGKYALIIGNAEYTDTGLGQLTAPGNDADAFARVLNDQGICAFDDVKVLMNEPEYIVREAIEEFFDQKKGDDLLVLYFSGHGVRDELGALYLAVKNTNRFRLRSTAVKSDFIREAMDNSRSKRQVLILDCCNSGAFAQGTKAATGVSIGTATAFEAGYGRLILTASDSTQFAWEGNQVIGETDNSLFTHFLVEGLEGKADLNGDGRITVDELYDYAYEQVKIATPKQTPSKFSSKQQGEIVLRQSMPLEDIRHVPLPEDLINEIEDPRPYVREAAVQKLDKILKGKNIGLARSAKEALEKIAADENTTRRVAEAAMQSLQSNLPEELIATPKEKVKQSEEKKRSMKPVAVQNTQTQPFVKEKEEKVEKKERQHQRPKKQGSITQATVKETQSTQAPLLRFGIVGVIIVGVIVLGYVIRSLIGMGGGVTATEPPELSVIPSNTARPAPSAKPATSTVAPARTVAPPPATAAPAPPVIESIDFPQTILCDGSRYYFPIFFHDADGDAYQVDWELIYSSMNTNLDSDPRDFDVDSQAQQNGTVFEDWIEWYVPGDEVQIRVYISDREGLSDSSDFSFRCSN